MKNNIEEKLIRLMNFYPSERIQSLKEKQKKRTKDFKTRQQKESNKSKRLQYMKEVTSNDK